MASKRSELRAALATRLSSDSSLQTLMGTDENSDFPLYEKHHATGLTTARTLVYELRSGYDAKRSAEGLRPMSLEITAEVKPTTTEPAEILDQIEERLDALLQDWRPVTTSLSVEHCIRRGEAQPTYDASGQGFEGRIWEWELAVDTL